MSVAYLTNEWGNFPHRSREIPPITKGGSTAIALIVHVCGERRFKLVGVSIASMIGESNVLRVAVFSIVVALAAGQNTALLCSVWCDPPEEAAGATTCRHEDQTGRSVNANDCQKVTVAAIAFVGEHVRRGVSIPNTAKSAVHIASFAFTTPVSEHRGGREPGAQMPLEARFLVLPLRI